MQKVSIVYNSQAAAFRIPAGATYAQVKSDAVRHFIGASMPVGRSFKASSGQLGKVSSGTASVDSYQLQGSDGNIFAEHDIVQPGCTLTLVPAPPRLPHAPERPPPLAVGARAPSSKSGTMTPTVGTPSSFSVVPPTAAGSAAMAVPAPPLSRRTSAQAWPSATASIAHGPSGPPTRAGNIAYGMVPSASVRDVHATAAAGPPVGTVPPVPPAQMVRQASAATSMQSSLSTRSVLTTATTATSPGRPSVMVSSEDARAAAADWVRIQAACGALPSTLLGQSWAAAGRASTALAQAKPNEVPRPTTHMPALPVATAAYLAVVGVYRVAGIPVATTRQAAGLLHRLCGSVPGWAMQGSAGALCTSWAPLPAVIGLLAVLCDSAADVLQTLAVSRALGEAGTGLATAMEPAAQARLASLREAAAGRLHRRAVRAMLHLLREGVHPEGSPRTMPEEAPASVLEALVVMARAPSLRAALLPGAPQLLMKVVPAVVQLIAAMWLPRAPEAIGHGGAVSSPGLREGVVTLATAYGHSNGPSSPRPVVGATKPIHSILSFHRAMTLAVDMGWVKCLALPLSVWLAAFLTVAGDGDRDEEAHAVPRQGRRTSYFARARPSIRRSDITLGSVREYQEDDEEGLGLEAPVEEDDEGQHDDDSGHSSNSALGGPRQGHRAVRSGDMNVSPDLLLDSPHGHGGHGLAHQASHSPPRIGAGRGIHIVSPGTGRDAKRRHHARPRTSVQNLQQLVCTCTMPAECLPVWLASVAVAHAVGKTGLTGTLSNVIQQAGIQAAGPKAHQAVLSTALSDGPALVPAMCDGVRQAGAVSTAGLLADVCGVGARQASHSPVAATTALVPVLLPCASASLLMLMQLTASALVRSRAEALVHSHAPEVPWYGPPPGSDSSIDITEGLVQPWPSRQLLDAGRAIAPGFFALRTADEQGGPMLTAHAQARVHGLLALHGAHAADATSRPPHPRPARPMASPLDYITVATAVQARLQQVLTRPEIVGKVAQALQAISAHGNAASEQHQTGYTSEDSDRDHGSGSDQGPDHDHDQDVSSGGSEQEDEMEQGRVLAHVKMTALAQQQRQAREQEDREAAERQAQADSIRRARASPSPGWAPDSPPAPVAAVPVVVLMTDDLAHVRAANETVAEAVRVVRKHLDYSRAARKGMLYLETLGRPYSTSDSAFEGAWLASDRTAAPTGEGSVDGDSSGHVSEASASGDEGPARPKRSSKLDPASRAQGSLSAICTSLGLALGTPGASAILEQATGLVLDAARSEANEDEGEGDDGRALCEALAPPPPGRVPGVMSPRRATTQLAASAAQGASADPTTIANTANNSDDNDTTGSETEELVRAVQAVDQPKDGKDGRGVTKAGSASAPAPTRARAVDMYQDELSADIDMALSGGSGHEDDGQGKAAKDDGQAAVSSADLSQGQAPAVTANQRRGSADRNFTVVIDDAEPGGLLPSLTVADLPPVIAQAAATWSSPETALQRLHRMMDRLGQARTQLAQEAARVYTMYSMVSQGHHHGHVRVDDLTALRTDTAEGCLADLAGSGDAAGATMYRVPAGADMTSNIILLPTAHGTEADHPLSTTRSTFASMGRSARLVSAGALRTSVAWAEYHAALACARMAEVALEALEWRMVIEARDRARQQVLDSARAEWPAEPKGQGRATTTSPGPAVSTVHVQLVLPASQVSWESYRDTAAMVDDLLGSACGHLERALLVRPPPWPAALQLLAEVLLARASLSYPTVITAAGSTECAPPRLRLPLPSPPGMLSYLTPPAAHEAKAGSEGPRGDTAGADGSTATVSSHLRASAVRPVQSFYHGREAATTMLLAARAAVLAAIPRTGNGTAAEGSPLAIQLAELQLKIEGTLAVRGLLLQSLVMFDGQEAAGRVRVVVDGAAPRGRPQGSLNRDGKGAGEDKGSSDASLSGPPSWSTRLCLPTYIPAFASQCYGQHEGTGHEQGGQSTTIAALSSAGLLAAWRLFEAFDQDGDGMLSQQELAVVWTALGPALDPTLAAWAKETEAGLTRLSLAPHGAGLPALADGDKSEQHPFHRVTGPAQRAALAVARATRLSCVAAWLSSRFTAGYAASKGDNYSHSSVAAAACAHALSSAPAHAAHPAHPLTAPALSVSVWASGCSVSLECIRRKMTHKATRHTYKAFSYSRSLAGFKPSGYLHVAGSLGPSHYRPVRRHMGGNSSTNPATVDALPDCLVVAAVAMWGGARKDSGATALKDTRRPSGSAPPASLPLYRRLARHFDTPLGQGQVPTPRHGSKHWVRRVPTVTRRTVAAYSSTLGTALPPCTVSALECPPPCVEASVACALASVTDTTIAGLGDDVVAAVTAASASSASTRLTGLGGAGVTFATFAELLAWCGVTDPLQLARVLMQAGLLYIPNSSEDGRAAGRHASAWRPSLVSTLVEPSAPQEALAAAALSKWLMSPEDEAASLRLKDVVSPRVQEAMPVPLVHLWLTDYHAYPDGDGDEEQDKRAAGGQAGVVDSIGLPVEEAGPDSQAPSTDRRDSFEDMQSDASTVTGTVTSSDNDDGRYGSAWPGASEGSSEGHSVAGNRSRSHSGLRRLGGQDADDEGEGEDIERRSSGRASRRFGSTASDSIAGLALLGGPPSGQSTPTGVGHSHGHRRRRHKDEVQRSNSGRGYIAPSTPRRPGHGLDPMGANRPRTTSGTMTMTAIRSRTLAAASQAAADSYGIAATYGFAASSKPAEPGAAKAGGASTGADSSTVPGRLGHVGPSRATTGPADHGSPLSPQELEEELLARAAAEQHAKDQAVAVEEAARRMKARQARREARLDRQAKAAAGQAAPRKRTTSGTQGFAASNSRPRFDSYRTSASGTALGLASGLRRGPSFNESLGQVGRQRSGTLMTAATGNTGLFDPPHVAMTPMGPARGPAGSGTFSIVLAPDGRTPTPASTPIRRPSAADSQASGNSGRNAALATAAKLARIRAGSHAGMAGQARDGQSSKPPAADGARKPSLPPPSQAASTAAVSNAGQSVADTYGARTVAGPAAGAKDSQTATGKAQAGQPGTAALPTPGPLPGLPAFPFDCTYPEDDEEEDYTAGMAEGHGHGGHAKSKAAATAAAMSIAPGGLDATAYQTLPHGSIGPQAALPPVLLHDDGRMEVDASIVHALERGQGKRPGPVPGDMLVSSGVLVTTGPAGGAAGKGTAAQASGQALVTTTVERMSALAAGLVSRLNLTPQQASLVPAALAVFARIAARRPRVLAALALPGVKGGSKPLPRGPLGGPPPRLLEYYACVTRGPLLADVEVDRSARPEDFEYSPVVGARVPRDDWRGCPLPGNVGLFVFPDGLRLSSGREVPGQPGKAASHEPPAPSSFTFVITGEDGSRLHAACVVTWEALHVDQGELLSALRPAVGGPDEMGMGPTPRVEDVALPHWLDPALVGRQPGPTRSRHGRPQVRHLYTPRAHILVSRQPAYSVLFATLRQLVAIGSQAAKSFAEVGLAMGGSQGQGAGADAPAHHRPAALAAGQAAIDRAVLPVILDVPMPPRGLLSVGFTLGSAHIIAARPPPNAPPLLDVPMALLFQCLDAGNVLAAFTALLCERRVAICSRHVPLLTPVAEALVALLFPFRWVANFIPVLPAGMAEIIGAPTPYLLGWPGTVEEAQAYSAETVFVDIDHNAVLAPAYAPLPRLPEAQRRKLLRALAVHAYGSRGGGPALGHYPPVSAAGPGHARNATYFSGFGFGVNSGAGGANNAAAGTAGGAGAGPQGSAPEPTGPVYGAEANPALRAWLDAQEGTGKGQSSMDVAPVDPALQMGMSPMVASGLAAQTAATPSAGPTPPFSPTPPSPALVVPSLSPPWAAPPGASSGDFYGGSVGLQALASSVPPTAVSPAVAPPASVPDSQRLHGVCFGWAWREASQRQALRSAHAASSGDEVMVANSKTIGRKGAVGPPALPPVSTAATAPSPIDSGSGADSDGGQGGGRARQAGRVVQVVADGDVLGPGGFPRGPIRGTDTSKASGSGAGAGSGPDTPGLSPGETGPDGVPGTDLSTGLSTSFHGPSIRDAFVRMLLSLLKGYGKYVRYSRTGTCSAAASAAVVHRMVVEARAKAAMAGEGQGQAASGSTNGAQDKPPLPPAPAGSGPLPGLCLPPLSLPVLSVEFDAPSFLAGDVASQARELVRAVLDTQMWQAFSQALVPSIYRGLPLPTDAPVAPVPWDPAKEDPAFYSRLPGSIRRFNALVNAKLNRLAGQRLTALAGLRSRPVRLDTSFLEDTRGLITRHVAYPPPLPPTAGLPLDVSIALTALTSMAQQVVQGSIPRAHAADGTGAKDHGPSAEPIDPSAVLTPNFRASQAGGARRGGPGATVAVPKSALARPSGMAAALASTTVFQGRRMSRVHLLRGGAKGPVAALTFEEGGEKGIDGAKAGLTVATAPGPTSRPLARPPIALATGRMPGPVASAMSSRFLLGMPTPAAAAQAAGVGAGLAAKGPAGPTGK